MADISKIKVPINGTATTYNVKDATARTHTTDSSRLTTDIDAGLYKVGCTAEGHIKELTAIVKSDITGLGIPGSDTNTVPSAYCSTAAGTAAKTAVCTDFTLTANTYLHVLIKNANTNDAKLTLNVNSTGAKNIWINGVVTKAGNSTLPAGTYIVYYDGSKYLFRTDGKLVTKDLIAGLGTAAEKDVPSSGDASLTQVVMGNDSRLTNSRTPTAHNQASNTIDAMTGYSKPSSTSAIEATDTLNQAIGKLEKGLDGKGTSNLTLGTSSSQAYYGNKGNTAYTHATETRLTTATAAGLYKVGSTAEGHISALTAIVKADITGLGIPGSDTNTRKSFFGTCDTAADTATKVVTLTNTDGWELKAGTIVGVRFSITNTASSVKLNVNGSGAKNISYSGGSNYTGTQANITGNANATTYYMFDGNRWVFLNCSANYRDTNTTYTAATDAPGKVDSASSVGTSTNYARQDHTHGIDLATGDANGQVKIAGTNVSVKGLGSRAYDSTDYLPLAGGTMTGDVYYKRASTDATKANNNVSSGVLYPRIKEIQDANGLRLVNLEAQINSNGKIGSYWNIRNYPVNSSSPVATGGIKMEMDKSGDITYTISDPYNFCEAIRSPRTTLVGNDSAIASGYGWYQVGKFETLSTKTDLSCMVMISNDYTNGTAANANAGLLYIHLRTGDTAGTFKHAEMKFIANNNFTTNHFKLVWRVEQDPVSLDNWMCYSLYTYIGVRYMRRRFTIMNEGYGKNNRNTFVLADKVTNSEVEPTTAQGWTNGIYAS